MALQGFSSGLKIANLDDFIAPSQECIKPVQSDSRIKKAKGVIKVEDDGDIGSLVYETPKITLNDCLACSGCVTSAEVILVNEQSVAQLQKVLESNKLASTSDKMVIVLSLSTQAVLSIARRHYMKPQEAANLLCGYFKSIGVNYVFDLSLASSLSLVEAGKEFVSRYKNNTDGHCLPMLCSACPGWVCYAEKTQGFTLPFISRTRSPQQMMGLIVKRFWSKNISDDSKNIFHVTLMPCFDKKLEASREQFFSADMETKEVDCVLTPVEIDQMLEESGIELSKMPPSPLDFDLALKSDIWAHSGSGSGGFAHYVFCYASKHLFQIDQEQLCWKTLKNNDMHEITLEVNGTVRLRFAIANGFRNIQNLVQKIKRRKCPYDYVEIMACPSGCLNGGAQLRQTEGMSSKELMEHMQALYGELPKLDPMNEDKLSRVYDEWFNNDETRDILRTSYKEVEKNINPLGIKW